MKKLLCLAFFMPLLSFSQLPGDDLYALDQVIRVDLTFNQTGFWDSLVANYPSETDMMAIGLTITDNTGVHVMDSIAIRLKGNSSYGHPGNKKSFKIDINQWVTGQDYDGMKKLNFNNGFKDPTFMREKLFFDLCKDLGIYAPRVNYANVYMNGTFWGFYTIVEQIDDQFLDWAIIDDLGNLFKAGDNSGGTTPADLMYYGAAASSYYSRYELKTNETINDWSDLISLISFINSSSATDFENNLATNVNKDQFIHSMVLDNLFSNLDSYANSGRNYYLYHNLTTSKWEWIKWDGNEAFGGYGGPGTGNLIQLAPNYCASSRPLLSKMLASSTLYAEYLDYMCTILETHFNSTYIDAQADSIKALIETHVAADNNKMYTTQNFYDNIEGNITVSGGMGTQTMFGLKSFVADRNTYLSGQLNCLANVTENELDVINVAPNPFTESFVVSGKVNVTAIQDVTGKDIPFTVSTEGSVQRIQLNKVNEGLYFVTLSLNGAQKTIQVLKK